MQTAFEYLIEAFGDSAKLIEGLDSWGSSTISGARLVIDKRADGSNYCAFTSCGGEAIICLQRNHTVDKRPMYLVLDRTEERRARAARDRATRKSQDDRKNMTAEDWHDYHKPTPFPSMRLVQSA